MRSSSSMLPLTASFPLQGKRRQEALLLDRISKALVICTHLSVNEKESALLHANHATVALHVVALLPVK